MLTITETRSHTAVPYLRLVSKKRPVNVHNNTWSTQHEWCIMIQELPAANVPEILVCLDCCILLNFGFLSSIGNWIFMSPPVHQYHPLLQCQMGVCKGPIPKPCWLPAGSVTTSPSVTNAYQRLLCTLCFTNYRIHTYTCQWHHCGFACSLVDCMQDKSCSWLGGLCSETNQCAGPHLQTYTDQHPRCLSS